MEKKGLNKLPVPTGWKHGSPGLCSRAASPPSPLGVPAGWLCRSDCGPGEQCISLPKEPEKLLLVGSNNYKMGTTIKEKEKILCLLGD